MFPERLIEEGTLLSTAAGFTAGLRLTWYRALPLSCVERVAVSVDGVPVDADSVRLTVDSIGPLTVSEMAPMTDAWWYVLDSAQLAVDCAAATEPGTHEITVVMGLHIPYLPVGGRPLVNLDTCTAALEVSSR